MIGFMSLLGFVAKGVSCGDSCIAHSHDLGYRCKEVNYFCGGDFIWVAMCVPKDWGKSFKVIGNCMYIPQVE